MAKPLRMGQYGRKIHVSHADVKMAKCSVSQKCVVCDVPIPGRFQDIVVQSVMVRQSSDALGPDSIEGRGSFPL